MLIKEYKADGNSTKREMTPEEITEYEKAIKEQEEAEKNKPPTIEEQILALQNALIISKISGGYNNYNR